MFDFYLFQALCWCNYYSMLITKTPDFSSQFNIKWKEERLPRRNLDFIFSLPWPSAWYEGTGLLAATIQCEDDYSPIVAETGRHRPLTIHLVDHSVRPLVSRTITGRFDRLSDVKKVLPDLLKSNPHFIPPIKVKPEHLAVANRMLAGQKASSKTVNKLALEYANNPNFELILERLNQIDTKTDGLYVWLFLQERTNTWCVVDKPQFLPNGKYKFVSRLAMRLAA